MDDEHRIVSSEAEELILVDEHDNETGYLSKSACHDGDGVLHRAFSVFLFDADGRLLLQRRADGKRLWPGYWSNSCCSHPRRGESLAVATARRLEDELNVSAELEFVYKFRYHADFGDAGAECELCHVFVGRVDADVTPNEHEISAVRLIALADVDAALAAGTERFTPWFEMEWHTLRTQHADVIARYAM